jgi:putative heme-binding domain-containing protein
MSRHILSPTLAATAGSAVFVLALLAGRPDAAADDSRPKPKRQPWISSKITGSPEPPPPFRSVRVFPEVQFNHPLLIARCPGTDRLFVGEQEGVIYSIANVPGAKKELFFDLRKEVKTIGKLPGAKDIGELYGLVFHPKFEENRYCYVCYTLRPKEPKGERFEDGTRVSRFTVIRTDPPRIDPASEEIVLTFVGGGHNGGDLHFGPDGMLYITTGDAAGPNPPDPLNTGQDCSDLLSSVLRIDVDTPGDPEGDRPRRNYRVPKDNPFVGLKEVRPEIWAYGFRNPWRMSFDRQTGDLWVGDVGWELWEMVHKVEKGGNYGWSIREARQPIKPDQKIGPTPIRPPMIELPHTIAASVTGGYVYRGKKFPELVGAYVFGDWETRRIWAARFENGRLKEMPEIVKPTVRPSAFGEDNAGELYYVDYDTGLMYTLERNDAAGANIRFPTKLTETGLFKDVAKHTMAEGVVEFEPNVRQWQDGARARYFLALPGLSSVRLFDNPRPLPGQVFWHNFRMQFPKDAVLVKTITLDVYVDGKLQPKRLETQLLHYDGEDWRGYTYAWRDDQTDADLVPADGAETRLEVPNTAKLPHKLELTWAFHSRNQCLQCHNAWAEYTLAFNPLQLNGGVHMTLADGSVLTRPNSLVDLNQHGYIQRVGADDKLLPPFDGDTAAKEPHLPNAIKMQNARDEEVARAYLHVNCAHCHRFGGGGGQVVLELDYTKPLKETGILDVKPRQGDFGLPDARLIKPGIPFQSVLLYRMTKFGRGRMPHLGSELPDPHGLRLMHQWIASLANGPRENGQSPEPQHFQEIEKKLRSTETAFPFAFRLSEGSFGISDSTPVLAAAAKLEPGPVRELFEGYLRPDPKGRKLGSNPRPATILSLKGDAARGEAIFFNTDMKCINCHKVGDRGTAVGPDLTTIGSTRSRAELLDSILHPSARIEPQYAAYNLRTIEEKTYTGFLVKRDDKQVVLRDAENQEIRLNAADVETITPSRSSLMPDGLIAGLTPQQAADLLEYLVNRK